MQLSIKGFIKPKESELYYDCADRFAYNKENHKFSISDGVSKSFFPKIWAETLVNNWVDKTWNTDNEFINHCQKKWLEDVTNIVQNPETKWFTKNAFNRRESALATFVGLNFFYQNSEYYWTAQALGDSFLFFVPKNFTDFKVDTIPISSKQPPIEFDNFPDYLNSIGTKHKGEKCTLKESLTEGTFYLMTDALAEWFLNEKENAIHKIKVWTGQNDFERFVDEERLNNKLGNDDSAILIIEVNEDGKKDLNYNEENTASIDELIENERINIKSSITSLVESNEKKQGSIDEVKDSPKQSANLKNEEVVEQNSDRQTKAETTNENNELAENINLSLTETPKGFTKDLETPLSSKQINSPEDNTTITVNKKNNNPSQQITDKF
ncbi:hypothetical protein [Maribacter dokdonensis]|uniref:hypothetical protein n=1 Tax=Maribacter dokdonensis TaxID=320912 RepID=UPI0007198F88|nr:hypothetical protein [Maribacter dokdonensis]KSA13480.1 hypothetical protein I600_70 [Maribacter dokdonensis DSW-8]